MKPRCTGPLHVRPDEEPDKTWIDWTALRLAGIRVEVCDECGGAHTLDACPERVPAMHRHVLEKSFAPEEGAA